MKVFKRNAVIITVLLFVAVAVYLNWSYNRGQDLAANYPVESETLRHEDEGEEESEAPEGEEERDPASLYFGSQRPSSVLSEAAMNYFDSARLTREQARDSATSLLQEAAAIGTASQEEIDNALNAITVMANHSLQEAQLENILMAKEFEQVVVFIRADGVSVIVNAPQEGLSEVSVARIMDAVIAEMDVGAEQITIIPVN